MWPPSSLHRYPLKDLHPGFREGIRLSRAHEREAQLMSSRKSAKFPLSFEVLEPLSEIHSTYGFEQSLGCGDRGNERVENNKSNACRTEMQDSFLSVRLHNSV